MKSVQKYAVMLYGSNYLLAKDNVSPRKYAFFVWRCVEADSQAEAEAIALQPPGSGYIYFGEGDDEEPPKGFFAKLRRKFSRVTLREW